MVRERRLVSVCRIGVGTLFVATSLLLADVKQDILALTGGVRAKAVWVRSAASQNLANLYNRGGSSILVGIDTDEGTIRTIDSIRGNHSYPLISRRGEYVVWNQDPTNNAWGGSSPNTVSWVIKWDGTGRTKLLDGAAGENSYVLSFMLDERTNQEWVYTCRLNNHNTNPNPKIFRYPFVNGKVDKTKEELVFQATGNPIPVVVSGQGKYLGGNFPWPNAHRVLASSGQMTQLNQDDDWSCWAQVAPDSSGRALHMKTDHANILMYTLATPKGGGKLININRNMPGNRGRYDCPGLRWSNHSRFIASGYPLGIDRFPLGIPKFSIGRFSAAFDSVEQWVTLPDTTSTAFNDQVGDLWLANGQGLGSTSVQHQNFSTRLPASGARISVNQRVVTASVSRGTIYDVAIVDLAGRVITQRQDLNHASVSLPLQANGVRLVRMRTSEGVIEKVVSTN